MTRGSPVHDSWGHLESTTPFPALVGRRRLSITVVLTRYANYYYFFLRCWIGKGSWESSQRRLGREDALDSARHVSTTMVFPCVKFLLGLGQM